MKIIFVKMPSETLILKNIRPMKVTFFQCTFVGDDCRMDFVFVFFIFLFLILPLPEKIKGSIFEIPIIP